MIEKTQGARLKEKHPILIVLDLNPLLLLLGLPPRGQDCLSSLGEGEGRSGAEGGGESQQQRLFPMDSPLTESKDSRSFSTKFSGGRIPRAGLLMNVLCKEDQRQTVTSQA